MTTHYDAICMGEILVDLVPSESTPWTYLARPGGAPANVAAGLAALGHQVAMLSRVGSDWFGEYLRTTLSRHRVSTELLETDPVASTGLAIVARASQSPPFILYREGTADTRIEFSEREEQAIAASRILHIGSLLLTSPTGHDAFDRAVRVAHDNDVLVSTDVNHREGVWESFAAIREASRKLIEAADIIKITATEMRELDLDLPALQASGRLWLVTDGPKESVLVRASTLLRATPRPVPVVDATGAGDASFAALLAFILSLPEAKIAELTRDQLSTALSRAIAAGEAAVQRTGAMAAFEEAP